MAADCLEVELCAPERARLHLKAREIVLPGEGGVFTVLPGHTSLLSTLLPGVVHVIDEKGEDQFYAVSGGFAEVRDDAVTILADTFESGHEIDVERAKERLNQAEAVLKRPSVDRDIARAELAMARAMARIRATRGEGY